MISIVSALFKDCIYDCVGSSDYESYTNIAVSKSLSQNCRSYVEQSRELRSVFAEVEVNMLPPVTAHTHGVSAAARSSASAFIDLVGPMVGKRPVFLQGSASDQRKGRHTTRHYCWGKDLNVAAAQAAKQDNDLTAMIDVDYYIDMPSHLATNFRPLILYTLQPSRSGKAVGDYKYCFEADGNIRYSVAGGGEYRHALWNWKGDSVSATRYLFGCIPLTYSIFAVERKAIDEDHQLVLITPLSKFHGIYAWIAKRKVACDPLTKFNPVDGEFVRVLAKGSSGLNVSTSRVGGYLSATVSVEVDEAIASAAKTTSRITHATLKSKMAGSVTSSGGNGEFLGSEILLEYHLRGDPRCERIDMVDAIRSYQWVKTFQDYNPEKAAMVSFMRPLYDGAFVPDACYNNDERMIEERVKKLKVDAKPPSDFLVSVMMEFTDKLVSAVGKLVPVDNDEVYRRQHRPAQRRILDEAQHGVSNNKASDFMKRECYPTVNDPRCITMINGVDKMDYSAYMYAVADALKGLDWYAFGKKPREIAQRVADLAEGASSHWSDTDCSRMDGRVNSTVRMFERILMVALFDPKEHLCLLKLMKSQTGLRARTKFGVRFNSGFSRASGSPETSVFNTLLNAFIAFLAFRGTRVNGAYIQADEAWRRLGIYGGDDGGTPDQDRKAVEKAASMMGQLMTVNITKRGQMGITFLARCYGPDVWWGDLNSCSNIRRQISKFHATVHLSTKVTPEIKLREKAFAFSLSDKNTPVLGTFVRKALEFYPMTRRDYSDLLNVWNSKYDEHEHYPNDNLGGWMDDLLTQQIPDFDIEGFNRWIDNVQNDGQSIFNPPVFAMPADPKPKPGLVVIDGDFVGVQSTPTQEPPPSTTVSVSTDASRRPWVRARKRNAYRKTRRPANLAERDSKPGASAERTRSRRKRAPKPRTAN